MSVRVTEVVISFTEGSEGEGHIAALLGAAKVKNGTSHTKENGGTCDLPMLCPKGL